jgi:hypothetical protein
VLYCLVTQLQSGFFDNLWLLIQNSLRQQQALLTTRTFLMTSSRANNTSFETGFTLAVPLYRPTNPAPVFQGSLLETCRLQTRTFAALIGRLWIGGI